jgi:hypothetical protein
MHDVDARLAEIAPFLKLPPPVDPATRDFLEIIYGPPTALPIDGVAPTTGTIEDSITSAEGYLAKQQAKGFLRDSSLTQQTAQYFKNRLQKKQQGILAAKPDRGKPQGTDLEALFKKEPFQEFWFDSDTVKRITKELAALPFAREVDPAPTICRFQDKVASVVRVMQHNGDLAPRRHNRAQLLDTMKSFIKQVRAIRSHIIGKLVQDRRVDYHRMTPELQDEFRDRQPGQTGAELAEAVDTQAAQSTPLDRVGAFEKFAGHGGGLFPGVYQSAYRRSLSDNASNPKSRLLPRKYFQDLSGHVSSALGQAQQEQEHARAHSALQRTESVMPAPARRRTPAIVVANRQIIPKRPSTSARTDVETDEQRRKKAHHTFWEAGDPLGTREGEYRDVLGELEALSDTLEYHNHLEDLDDMRMPFTLECEQVIEPARVAQIEGDGLKDEIWTTADLDSGRVHEHVEELLPAQTESAPHMYSLEASEDLKFLLNQSFHSTAVGDPELRAEAIQKRLEDIWEALGFSIQQKLALLLKYSTNLEESAKLSNALRFWEQALSVANQYEAACQSYKDMIQLEAKMGNPTRLLDDCASQMKAAEESLMQVASALKSTFGDEFIIRRRKVQELIDEKRQKNAWHRSSLGK